MHGSRVRHVVIAEHRQTKLMLKTTLTNEEMQSRRRGPTAAKHLSFGGRLSPNDCIGVMIAIKRLQEQAVEDSLCGSSLWGWNLARGRMSAAWRRYRWNLLVKRADIGVSLVLVMSQFSTGCSFGALIRSCCEKKKYITVSYWWCTDCESLGRYQCFELFGRYQNLIPMFLILLLLLFIHNFIS